MADTTYNHPELGSVPVDEVNRFPVVTFRRINNWAKASVPVNTNVSSPLMLPDGYRISKLAVLSTWTTADMFVQCSDDNGVTWQYLTQFGDLIKLSPKAGMSIALDTGQSLAVSQKLIRFVSGTNAALAVSAVNQTTAQTINISLVSA